VILGKALERIIRKGVRIHLTSIIIITIIILTSIQTYSYVSYYWIDNNIIGYSFMKNTIETNAKDNSKIHVYGVLVPGQGNVYSSMAARWALRELGYNPDEFNITVSDNDYMISILQDNDYSQIASTLSAEDALFFESLYIHDDTYGRYLSNGTLLTEDIDKIRTIFVHSGYLISEDDEDTIFVDLRWIKSTWE
jgi:hypothetical protein